MSPQSSWKVRVEAPNGNYVEIVAYPEYMKHDARPADVLFNEPAKRMIDEMFYREDRRA